MILSILVGGTILGVFIAAGTLLLRGKKRKMEVAAAKHAPISRDQWRMPPLHKLLPAHLSLAARSWMLVLRAYLVLAAGLILCRIVTLSIGLA